MTNTSLPQPSLNPSDDHQLIAEDAREHPERTPSEHIEAAERIASESYREEIRALMRAGKL